MEYTRNLPVKSRKGLDKFIAAINKIDPWNLEGTSFQELLGIDVLKVKEHQKLLELYDILNDISMTLMTDGFTDEDLEVDIILLDTLCATIDEPNILIYYYNIIGCMLACLRNNMMAEGLDIDEKNIVVMWLVALMRLVWRTIGQAEVEDGDKEEEEENNEKKKI